MSGKKIHCNDKKIEKRNFYKNKKLFNIDDIDVNKISVSKKEPYAINKSFKYFIGYNDNDVFRPLCLKLLRMTGCVKIFHKDTRMSLRVNNKQLLKNYNTIWEKVENLIKINFESKPSYGNNGDKYIKTK